LAHRPAGLHAGRARLITRRIRCHSKDGRFVAAQAAIDGDSVVVSIPAVPQPLFVRYAWADYPAANLTNREGLPAAPFRSDR